MDRLRTFGLAAAGGVLAVATIVFVVGSQSGGDIGPPAVVPRGLALGLLVSVPAIIGLLGVVRRDPVLLIAAAGASLGAGLTLASIVTLPLVIPALLFVLAAVGGTAPARRATWLIAGAIVGLQIGALVGLVANTEAQCWVAYESDTGLVYRQVSEAETQQLMGGAGLPVAGGCDGGALTVRGVGLAAVLVIGSIALAFGAPRPLQPQPA
jgi:hypothetical protein